MRLTIEMAGYAYTCQSIGEFLGEGFPSFQETILHELPVLQGRDWTAMPQEARAQAVSEALLPAYEAILPELRQKVTDYQAYWDERNDAVAEAFAQAMGAETAHGYDDLRMRVSINPIAPRYLQERCFDCYWRYSPKGAMSVSLHEITHFIWFDLWQNLFHDDPATYENPHPAWILSEMAVDPILRDPRLRRFVAHPGVADAPAYPAFYTLAVDGVSVMDTIRRLYAENDLQGFMRAGLAYVTEHAETIIAAL